MNRYPALIDGEPGSYGVAFPNLPGIVAMGTTIDEALLQAERALKDYAIETERAGDVVVPPSAPEQIEAPPGHALVLVSIPLGSGRVTGAEVWFRRWLQVRSLARANSKA